MRSEYGHIDDAFRDKLKDIEVSVPIDTWEGISAQIAKPKNNFTWMKIAASFAAIAVVGSLLWFVDRNVDTTEIALTEEINQVIDVPVNVVDEQVAESNSQELNNENISISENDVSENEVLINVVEEVMISSLDQEESLVKQFLPKINLLDPINMFIAQKTIDVDIVIAKENIVVKKQMEIIEPEIDLLLAYDNIIEKDVSDSKKGNWIVGGDFTPLYSYRNIAKSSTNYDAAYYNKVESPVMTYTGGLNLEYEASKRLSVQAGVYYTTMGQSLDYMTVYSNKAYDMVADEYKDRLLNFYQLDNSSGLIQISTSYVIVDEIAARVNNMSSNKGYINTADPVFQDVDAEIQQSFQYIEVPLLLRYKLIDRLVDFNLVGGIGANFLIGNDIILSHGNKTEVIGETKGVEPVNYTSSFGIGIEYPIMKKLSFRLEPSIKYYLNSLSSSSDVESHPYSFGVYTGFSFTF